jgi:hypothetical protein
MMRVPKDLVMQSEKTELTVRHAHLHITPGIYFQQELTQHKMLGLDLIPGRTCIQNLGAGSCVRILLIFLSFSRQM